MTASRNVEARRLGNGPSVFPLALGCMAMSGTYGPTDDAESIATIHAAIDGGINLLDTGDYYNAGHNELLIARALRDRRNRALLSVKFGALRGPNGAWLGIDLRPAAVKNSLSYSLTRLGVDHIDIYRPGRFDPNVPVEETVGAMAEMVAAGYVRFIGLSEVGADTVKRAHAVHPVSDLQIEYSLVSRGAEAKIFPALEQLGIGATLYGALSRGLLTGSRPTGPRDLRGHLPRFSADNLDANQGAVDTLRRLAAERGCTPSQLAIAWVLAKRPRMVPVIGPRTRAQLADSMGALDIVLSAGEIAQIETMLPPSAVAGTRYDERQMRSLDSER